MFLLITTEYESDKEIVVDSGGKFSYFWRISNTTDMKDHSETRPNGVEKRSVSAPPSLFAEADKRAEERHMSNFSEYVRDLMRRDAEGQLLQPKPEAKAA